MSISSLNNNQANYFINKQQSTEKAQKKPTLITTQGEIVGVKEAISKIQSSSQEFAKPPIKMVPGCDSTWFNGTNSCDRAGWCN